MKRGGYNALGLVLSHGVTMAVTLYLAYRGGVWLDKRFGTEPWLMIVSILMMVAANLHLLIKDVLSQTGSDRGDQSDKPR